MTCKHCGKHIDRDVRIDGMGNTFHAACALELNRELGESLEDDEGGVGVMDERIVLIKFLDDLRKYMRESDNNIGYDERKSEEFVDIYLAKKE